jgi:crossover junction endodeoxyribonuclease RusA
MILLPYPPSNNRYFRNFRGRMVISAEGKAFKNTAGWLCKTAGVKVLQGDVELQVILHPKLNKDGSASKVRLDLDNIFKPVCDCMNGVAYQDDKQIVKIGAVIGIPVKDGGISVLVTRAFQ